MRFINGEPFEQLAMARRAGPAYEDQQGDLVGVDYQATDGGMCNVRFTREQARALRDVLTLHLKSPKRRTFEIVKAKDGRRRTLIDP